ncbi:MAG TPA: triose-phosphate isomerase [Gemmatimonadales bacterium]|nr:triose-phosphate isomerase [Gemmatimonadales bacterium]
MNKPLLLAANWKMHMVPQEAIAFLDRFLELNQPSQGRTVAFFPPAVTIANVAWKLGNAGRTDVIVGAQNVYWEPKGAFTGETSVALARGAGASAALIGHSERRHVFGETDAETAKKVQAVLAGGMMAVLCVGEKLEEREADEDAVVDGDAEEREAGDTAAVVERQLRAGLDGVAAGADIVIAYEPVWAIGTGRNATPADADAVHATIRGVLESMGLSRTTRVLYGGSVKPENAAELMAMPNIDGVLVGGASLDPEGWARICGGSGT